MLKYLSYAWFNMTMVPIATTDCDIVSMATSLRMDEVEEYSFQDDETYKHDSTQKYRPDEHQEYNLEENLRRNEVIYVNNNFLMECAHKKRKLPRRDTKQLEGEISALKNQLKTAHRSLYETHEQMELQRVRTRQLISGWKLRLGEGEEALRCHQLELDEQMKRIVTELYFFEGKLRKEKADIQITLQEKDRIIDQQTQIINRLLVANHNLTRALKATRRKLKQKKKKHKVEKYYQNYSGECSECEEQGSGIQNSQEYFQVKDYSEYDNLHHLNSEGASEEPDKPISLHDSLDMRSKCEKRREFFQSRSRSLPEFDLTKLEEHPEEEMKEEEEMKRTKQNTSKSHEHLAHTPLVLYSDLNADPDDGFKIHKDGISEKRFVSIMYQRQQIKERNGQSNFENSHPKRAPRSQSHKSFNDEFDKDDEDSCTGSRPDSGIVVTPIDNQFSPDGVTCEVNDKTWGHDDYTNEDNLFYDAGDDESFMNSMREKKAGFGSEGDIIKSVAKSEKQRICSDSDILDSLGDTNTNLSKSCESIIKSKSNDHKVEKHVYFSEENLEIENRAVLPYRSEPDISGHHEEAGDNKDDNEHGTLSEGDSFNPSRKWKRYISPPYMPLEGSPFKKVQKPSDIKKRHKMRSRSDTDRLERPPRREVRRYQTSIL